MNPQAFDIEFALVLEFLDSLVSEAEAKDDDVQALAAEYKRLAARIGLGLKSTKDRARYEVVKAALQKLDPALFKKLSETVDEAAAVPAIVTAWAEKAGMKPAEALRRYKKAGEIVGEQYPKVEKESDQWYRLKVGIFKGMMGFKAPEAKPALPKGGEPAAGDRPDSRDAALKKQGAKKKGKDDDGRVRVSVTVGGKKHESLSDQFATHESEVGKTILAQLGGNRFLAMTGASNLVGSENALSMKVGKNDKGVTHVRIRLESDDTYTVEFLRVRGTQVKTISTRDGVYADALRTAFTSGTGLDTSLGTMGKTESKKMDETVFQVLDLLSQTEGFVEATQIQDALGLPRVAPVMAVLTRCVAEGVLRYEKGRGYAVPLGADRDALIVRAGRVAEDLGDKLSRFMPVPESSGRASTIAAYIKDRKPDTRDLAQQFKLSTATAEWILKKIAELGDDPDQIQRAIRRAIMEGLGESFGRTKRVMVGDQEWRLTLDDEDDVVDVSGDVGDEEESYTVKLGPRGIVVRDQNDLKVPEKRIPKKVADAAYELLDPDTDDEEMDEAAGSEHKGKDIEALSDEMLKTGVGVLVLSRRAQPSKWDYSVRNPKGGSSSSSLEIKDTDRAVAAILARTSASYAGSRYFVIIGQQGKNDPHKVARAYFTELPGAKSEAEDGETMFQTSDGQPVSVDDVIRNGDRVTIRTPQGQTRSGKAVMRGPHGWVLNLGGAHGTPGIATDQNVVTIKRGGKTVYTMESEEDAPNLLPDTLDGYEQVIAEGGITTMALPVVFGGMPESVGSLFLIDANDMAWVSRNDRWVPDQSSIDEARKAKGYWRTTKGGRRIYIENGKITKGNPHVLAHLKSKNDARTKEHNDRRFRGTALEADAQRYDTLADFDAAARASRSDEPLTGAAARAHVGEFGDVDESDSLEGQMVRAKGVFAKGLEDGKRYQLRPGKPFNGEATWEFVSHGRTAARFPESDVRRFLRNGKGGENGLVMAESVAEARKLTPEQAAAKLTKDIAAYKGQFQKPDDEKDAEFQRMIAADCARLEAVRDLLAKGDVKAAYKRYVRLDTAVRDAVSHDVWMLMSGGGAPGHTEWDESVAEAVIRKGSRVRAKDDGDRGTVVSSPATKYNASLGDDADHCMVRWSNGQTTQVLTTDIELDEAVVTERMSWEPHPDDYVPEVKERAYWAVLDRLSLTALQGIARRMEVERMSSKDDQVSVIMGELFGDDWEEKVAEQSGAPDESVNENFPVKDALAFLRGQSEFKGVKWERGAADLSHVLAFDDEDTALAAYKALKAKFGAKLNARRNGDAIDFYESVEDGIASHQREIPLGIGVRVRQVSQLANGPRGSATGVIVGQANGEWLVAHDTGDLEQWAEMDLVPETQPPGYEDDWLPAGWTDQARAQEAIDQYVDTAGRRFTAEELRHGFEKWKSPNYGIEYDAWVARHFAKVEEGYVLAKPIEHAAEVDVLTVLRALAPSGPLSERKLDREVQATEVMRISTRRKATGDMSVPQAYDPSDYQSFSIFDDGTVVREAYVDGRNTRSVVAQVEPEKIQGVMTAWRALAMEYAGPLAGRVADVSATLSESKIGIGLYTTQKEAESQARAWAKSSGKVMFVADNSAEGDPQFAIHGWTGARASAKRSMVFVATPEGKVYSGDEAVSYAKDFFAESAEKGIDEGYQHVHWKGATSLRFKTTTSTGKKTVQGRTFGGKIGIHMDNKVQGGEWVVTHIPTGLRIGGISMWDEQAVRMAKHLEQRLGDKLDFTDPATVDDETKRIIKLAQERLRAGAFESVDEDELVEFDPVTAVAALGSIAVGGAIGAGVVKAVRAIKEFLKVGDKTAAEKTWDHLSTSEKKTLRALVAKKESVDEGLTDFNAVVPAAEAQRLMQIVRAYAESHMVGQAGPGKKGMFVVNGQLSDEKGRKGNFIDAVAELGGTIRVGGKVVNEVTTSATTGGFRAGGFSSKRGKAQFSPPIDAEVDDDPWDSRTSEVAEGLPVDEEREDDDQFGRGGAGGGPPLNPKPLQKGDRPKNLGQQGAIRDVQGSPAVETVRFPVSELSRFADVARQLGLPASTELIADGDHYSVQLDSQAAQAVREALDLQPA